MHDTAAPRAISPTAQTPPARLPLQPKPRLDWIDTGRGLAILMVVANHVLGYLRSVGAMPVNFPGPGDIHGESGVDTLLLLSGFGLAFSARQESIWRFLSRRLWRILPAYWVVLLPCWGLQLVRQTYGNDMHWAVKDLFIHATCLHLIWGQPYTHSIDAALWFMGLIVPVYVIFSLIRPIVLTDRCYTALGVTTGVMSLGGVLFVRFVPEWGFNHAPHRLATFFVGAIVGVMYRRRDSIDVLLRQPALALGLFIATAGPVYFGYLAFPFYLSAGLMTVFFGMALASAASAGRGAWAIKPVYLAAVAAGLIGYELYLCHQYLIVTVGHQWFTPWLSERWPSLGTIDATVVSTALLVAASLWVALGVHSLVAWRDSYENWRLLLTTVTVLSVLSVAVAIGYTRSATGATPGKIYHVSVLLPAGGAPSKPLAEPIFSWGTVGHGDLIFLEHNGRGLARIGIDHWGSAVVLSDWTDAPLLAGEPWEIKATAVGISVRAPGAKVSSNLPPFDTSSPYDVGRNTAGFTSALPQAVSSIVVRNE